ncbi:UDP binding domain-containing protein, partial [Rhizobium sp. SIMBA_035]
GLLGLAFKANIDDLRESPAIAITETLAAELGGRRINVSEPHIGELPKSLSALTNVHLSEDAVERSQVVVLLVDHDEFKALPAA